MVNKFGIPDDVEKSLRARDKKCAYCKKGMKEYPAVKNGAREQATIEHLNFHGPFYWKDGLKKKDLVMCCRSCNSHRGTKQLLDWFKSTYCMARNINEVTVAEPVKEYIHAHIGTPRKKAAFKESLRDFLDQQDWIFAKTMPQIPHHYIVRDKLSDVGKKMFDAVKDSIKVNGYSSVFASKTYTYTNIGDYKYWVISNVLNRAKIHSQNNSAD